MRRALILGLLLVAGVARAQAPLPQVQVAAPLARTVPEWDEFTGRFEAVAYVEVRPRVSGFIDQIGFKDGQIVKEGDLLFTIDPRPYQIAVDSARADVERNVAQVELATLDVRRGEPLAASQALSQSALDSRRSTLKQAVANRDSAAAALRNAELNLSWTQVRAPIGGRISNRRVDVGNLVAGGTGVATPTLLTTIVALDPIYFTFDAAEADYIKYVRLAQSGQRPSGRTSANPVEVRLADEARWVHKGTLDFVDNVVNSRTGTIRGRGVFDNKDQFLTPGTFGRLRLWGGDANVLLVPDAAVQSDQARKIVLVVGADGVVGAKQVTVGPMALGLRIVRAGLTAEDRVVVNGFANPFVRPGAKVVANPGKIEPAGGN
jgi:RND family efflux transporter MFP subunit